MRHHANQRPGIVDEQLGFDRDLLRPRLFDDRHVFDQSTNAERADGRRAAGLLIGQAVGHRDEYSLVIPHILEQALPLTGNGHGYDGHTAKFPVGLLRNSTFADIYALDFKG